MAILAGDLSDRFPKQSGNPCSCASVNFPPVDSGTLSRQIPGSLASKEPFVFMTNFQPVKHDAACHIRFTNLLGPAKFLTNEWNFGLLVLAKGLRAADRNCLAPA
jgi:hypothetical protein